MLGPFACARFRLVLEAVEPLRLSAFAGATLRGGFGHVFKQTVCSWPVGDCPRCLLRHCCAYPYVFETAPPPGAERLRNLEQVPRPFVLEPPETGQDYRPGERFDFGLVLVGRGIDYLPYFVLAFQELGERGLGRALGRYRLREVHAATAGGWERVFDAATGTLAARVERFTVVGARPPQTCRLAVDYVSPVRVRNDGAIRREMTFQDLVRALLRRLSSLIYFHCGGELAVDFRGLIERACTVRTVQSELRWHEQDRFSGRQRQRIDMGGLVGRVVYEVGRPEEWEAYWPLLAAGEWVHVGKGCVMGLGRYRVVPGGAINMDTGA
jgi:hypothetical protein